MNRIAVLCDFDGTIAKDDVGNLFFRTFARKGDPAPVVDLWKRGAISSRECLEREAAFAEVSHQEMVAFVRQRKLDPYFKDFVDFTRKRGIEVVIVSDGLDRYIEQLLMRSGVGEIEFYSNLMRIVDGNVHVSFPHYDKLDCQECGNCKSFHLEKYRHAGCFIIYVGNGLSDRCPCQRSDFVLAKDDLLDFCRENNVRHAPFTNFRDVEREILQRFVIGAGKG